MATTDKAKNTAEQTIYATEKLLNENKDKISEDDQKSLNEKVATLREKNAGTDGDAIDSATQELTKVMNEVATKMYQASQDAEKNATEAKAEEAKPEDAKPEEPKEGENPAQ